VTRLKRELNEAQRAEGTPTLVAVALTLKRSRQAGPPGPSSCHLNAAR
jgi:hypothetical protein